MDPKALRAELSLRDGARSKRPHLGVDAEGVSSPVDPGFGFGDFGGVGDSLAGLRMGRQLSGRKAIERREECRGAERGERAVQCSSGVAGTNGDLTLEEKG